MALALGCTLGQLNRISERELRIWLQYAAEKGFPSRRTEVQLAMIALTVARSMGGNSELTLDDFMIEKTRVKTPTVEDTAQLFGAMAGVKVRRLGQGSKK